MFNKFEDIIKQAIGEAERVRCSKRDFLAGLKDMLSELEERIGIEHDFQEGENDE